MNVKKETLKLQKSEMKAEERLRREKAEVIDRETERLRKLAHDEYIAKKKHDEAIEKETERLRWQEGWYNDDKKTPEVPPRPPSQKKKHWWSISNINGNGQLGQKDIHGYQTDGPPKYSVTGARMMGYSR